MTEDEYRELAKLLVALAEGLEWSYAYLPPRDPVERAKGRSSRYSIIDPIFAREDATKLADRARDWLGHNDPMVLAARSACCGAVIVAQAPGSGDLTAECSRCHTANPAVLEIGNNDVTLGPEWSIPQWKRDGYPDEESWVAERMRKPSPRKRLYIWVIKKMGWI